MQAPATFLNFAYGSNMLTRRLQARVSSARVVATAVLHGYELCWHKVSTDASGKCDVVQTEKPHAKVLGVVHEVATAQKTALDEAEGLGKGYAEKQVVVETPAGRVTAWLYFATSIDPLAMPYTWYKALVIAGARQHSFPQAYVRALENVASKEDSNAKRAAANLLIANAG